jgi:hypothetical protein
MVGMSVSDTEVRRKALAARNLEASYDALHPEWSRARLWGFLCSKFPSVMPFRYRIASLEPKPDHQQVFGLTYDFSKLVTATLHIGFLCIIESEEELSRLREGEPKSESKIARSKIGKTPLSVQPIDRVAKRVANVDA